MITPLLILKKTKTIYQNHWQKILLFSSLLTLNSVLIFVINFIQNAYPKESTSISVVFWIILTLLSLGLMFLYVNFVHFLYEPNKKTSIVQLFSNWRWDILVKSLWIFIFFMIIFSLGFTFPLLILNTLTSILNITLINIFFWIITGISISIAIIIFNYLQFAYTLAILRKNDNIKNALTNSFLLIKKRWWNAFLNQTFIIILVGLISFLTMKFFLEIYPDKQIFLIQNGILKVSGLFLVSYLLTYTVIIFINLNLSVVYNLEFFKIYEKTLNKE